MGGHGTGTEEPVRRIGPYRIVAPLGEGGMGAVHLGRDRRGRPAAVKVLRAELAQDAEMVRRFRREADAASAVRGPGVAQVLGYDLDGPVPWIAAAYLAGPTLQEAVRACGPFAGDAARALTAELARTVAVIHDAGLVHRDLKPSNIVLTRSGARIIDFGIARPEYGLTLTQPGVAPATPGYAPPEQITGRRAGPPADVFALGAVLVFACTGEGPFGSGYPATVGYRVVHEEPPLDGVPEALLPVVRACLQKEPTRRPTPGVVAGWMEKETQRDGPGWLTAPLTTEIARRAEEADRLLRAAAPSRRRVLTAAAAVPVAGIATGAWWLTRDRATPAEGPRTENGVPVAAPLAAPTADTVPAPLWRAEGLHPDGPGPVTVGPVVAAGTADGVAAWTQHTGRRAWTWTGRTARDRHGDLLVSGTAVLVVTADGRLTALDSRTGGARWRTGDIGAVQTLAVDDGSAYVLDGDRRVQAVALTDHRSRWTSPRPVGGTGTARAAVTRQRLMVSTDDGTALVLDTRDGSASWRWTVGKPVLWNDGRAGAPAPAVHDGAFCVGGDSLALLDAHSRRVRWSHDPDSGWYGAPTVAGGRVYAGLPADLWCLDAGTGDAEWTVSLAYSGIPMRSDVVVGHALYGLMGSPADSTDGTGADEGVFTVDIRSGTLLWTFDDQAERPGWRLAGGAGRVFVARGTTLRAMPTL
ncbi:PQQ-binding-like beta-propeller repeat protein [Streptomyces sp. NPDC051963]|uniref:protein kinase domain-containing protein n=1 Tax=Streptomyces sp. NPDC051963 TaxID=3365678 RepID=UPI0037CD1FEF